MTRMKRLKRRTSPRLGVIFDTISVKVRWERWCRCNCDLRVINARKKGIFCRTESVAMTPKSRDHMPTTSLWGVAAKWPTWAPRRNWYFARETHKIQPYQFEPVRQDFERVPEHHVSFEANHQMGVMRRSKKVSSFEMYKPNPLSPHCGSIARELVHCYIWGCLWIVTVRGNTVGWHS